MTATDWITLLSTREFYERGDWFDLAAAADYWEEQGDPVMYETLRWCVKEKHKPHVQKDKSPLWSWFDTEFFKYHPSAGPDDVDRELINVLGDGERCIDHGSGYLSWENAIHAMHAALKETGRL